MIRADRGGNIRIFRLEDLLRGGNRYLLADGADFQGDIQAAGLLRLHRHALGNKFLETRSLHSDGVIARREFGNAIIAYTGRDCLIHDARALIGDRNLRAGDHSAFGIQDRALNAGLELCAGANSKD